MGAKCGFMSWDVPTAEDCPKCGQTMFKKAGKGRNKPFCINEQCENFLPEDKRGYYKKKETEEQPAEVTKTKKTAKASGKAASKTTAKKTATKKTTKKKEDKA
jgi:DNA topoisomerase-1